MRIFISADIEGIAGVVSREHQFPEGIEWQSARLWMTDSVAAAAEAAFEAGAIEVVVADSHGQGHNLLLDRLRPEIQVVRSHPRPLSMMQGVEAGRCGGCFLSAITPAPPIRAASWRIPSARRRARSGSTASRFPRRRSMRRSPAITG